MCFHSYVLRHPVDNLAQLAHALASTLQELLQRIEAVEQIAQAPLSSHTPMAQVDGGQRKDADDNNGDL